MQEAAMYSGQKENQTEVDSDDTQLGLALNRFSIVFGDGVKL